ncbi:MAG: Rrf2 family transcriptional regulator [Candidatus Omnitrophica bacterium]|nr:Rrf2 family transcriptional regulator [Candidatus Omnitrophota bacterium]
MKVSTRVRYGMRLMVNLAANYRKGQTLLKDIAENEEISEKYLSQIVLLLKSQGLVNSFRGAKGGYTLAKNPREITLKEIYEAIDGQIELVECVNDALKCNRSAKCVTSSLWKSLGAGIAIILGTTTLNDLAKNVKIESEKQINYCI